MTDESFKYTLHDRGNSREVVGNNYDVYTLLRDKIDLEVCKLERQINWLRKSMHALFIMGIGSSMCMMMISAWVIWGK